MEKFYDFLTFLPTGLPSVVLLQDAKVAADSGAEALLTANNIWMMLSAALVFIMHLGFASVEAGFTQAKNTVNILFKNTLTPVIGVVTYALVGFSLMYPGDFGGYLGFNKEAWDLIWMNPSGADVTAAYADGGYTFWTDFLFQAMFAATC